MNENELFTQFFTLLRAGSKTARNPLQCCPQRFLAASSASEFAHAQEHASISRYQNIVPATAFQIPAIPRDKNNENGKGDMECDMVQLKWDYAQENQKGVQACRITRRSANHTSKSCNIFLAGSSSPGPGSSLLLCTPPKTGSAHDSPTGPQRMSRQQTQSPLARGWDMVGRLSS